jgi:hypothetical protein
MVEEDKMGEAYSANGGEEERAKVVVMKAGGKYTTMKTKM